MQVKCSLFNHWYLCFTRLPCYGRRVRRNVVRCFKFYLMKLFKIVKYSFLIGFVSVVLMIIDFKFILNQYSLFGYIEFWGTIILFTTALYFLTKKSFIENPGASQFQLFYPALAISLLSALFYGAFSWLFIVLFAPEYLSIVSAKAMAHIPKSFTGDTEGIAFGLVFIYSPIFLSLIHI